MYKVKSFFASLLLIWLFHFNGFAAKVERISVVSDYLGKKSPLTVLLPESYVDSDSLPVIFLLHGYSGNNDDYIRLINGMASYVDQLNVVVVCVNGEGSWYVDSPVNKESRYESYIIKELIPFVSKKYKVYRSGNKRGIVGLSMGGFGALYLGFKNPSCFGYVGSMSGGVDVLPFSKNWGLSGILGSSDNVKQWKLYSPFYLIDSIDVNQIKFKLVLDCGIEDFFYEVNNNFDKKLTGLGIAHEYLVSGGGHEWMYWNKMLPVHLNKFCESIKQ